MTSEGDYCDEDGYFAETSPFMTDSLKQPCDANFDGRVCVLSIRQGSLFATRV